MGEKIGYARVSSDEQNLDAQVAYLKSQGVSEPFLFVDKCSGTIKPYERTGMRKCLDTLRHGDTLIVYRLDRLSRVTDDTKELVNQLQDKGIVIQSSEIPDFSTLDVNMRKMIMDIIVSVLAYSSETERLVMRERQRAGIEKAKERGVYKGQPKKYSADSKDAQGRFIYHQIKQYLSQGYSYKQIREKLGVGSGTITRIKDEMITNNELE